MTNEQTQAYSVLKCKPIQGVPWNYTSSSPTRKLSYSHASPHYHIVAQTDGGQQYTIVINIESKDPSTPMLLYYIDENFNNELTLKLINTFNTSYSINQPPCSPNGIALDYVKSNLFDHTKMLLENYLPDGEDSLNSVIDGYIKDAINADADIYAFGMEFEDNQGSKGIHDIHMNQGNEQQYSREDGAYQDGALLINYPSQNKWIAMFFAFQSQSFNTDADGHRID